MLVVIETVGAAQMELGSSNTQEAHRSVQYSPFSKSKRKSRMKYLVVILLLAAVAVAQTYTTNFPLTENPISEGGKWINAGVVGLDWNNIRTTPGFAFGTDPGTVPYADAWALLIGTWGPDQTAQATIKDQNPNTNCYQEHELVLRGNLSAHSATGYEITVRATNDANSYLLIARWNGALGNFSILTFLSGSAYGVKTGDVFEATIVGNVIRAYINGCRRPKSQITRMRLGILGWGFILITQQAVRERMLITGTRTTRRWLSGAILSCKPTPGPAPSSHPTRPLRFPTSTHRRRVI